MPSLAASCECAVGVRPSGVTASPMAGRIATIRSPLVPAGLVTTSSLLAGITMSFAVLERRSSSAMRLTTSSRVRAVWCISCSPSGQSRPHRLPSSRVARCPSLDHHIEVRCLGAVGGDHRERLLATSALDPDRHLDPEVAGCVTAAALVGAFGLAVLLDLEDDRLLSGVLYLS